MILGFLLLGILIDSLTTTNKWNNPDGGGVWISKNSNFFSKTTCYNKIPLDKFKGIENAFEYCAKIPGSS